MQTLELALSQSVEMALSCYGVYEHLADRYLLLYNDPDSPWFLASMYMIL